ncbi:hypothetical protein LOTGIDRAFT_166380 [Lottia gigantea]|uniref:EGF-like domain-containing protein n=1 Tax=Lottia gigantea TaxID=225164 RepID=V3Z9C0_LOTGI|nr:hypothetical protein LOTGIDRAFT_166380 [Lottia gigantea]ESO87503.1 hypothetical protein LOTGIDRAFT_166380 [Lottia gigantea]
MYTMLQYWTGVVVWMFLAHLGETRDCPGSRFGSECKFRCHCKDQASCNVKDGGCPAGCDAGWSGTACQRQNLAYLAPVEIRKVPDRGVEVVDEDVTTCVSSIPNRTGWLKIDLGSSQLVYSMRLVPGTVIFRIPSPLEVLEGPNTSMINWRIHVTDENHDDIFWGFPCTTLKSEEGDVQCDQADVYGRYVSIFSLDRPVNVCDFHIYSCSNYTYGKINCNGRCSCLNSTEVCQSILGTCKSGCRPGLTGSGCDQVCVMSYGSSCVHNCGECYDGESCDRISGVCPAGCEPGYTGSKCTEVCLRGYYGISCRFPCGHCKNSAICDHVTGYCLDGCKSGWFGRKCLKECKRGSYGEDCKFTCLNCISSLCNKETGLCTIGCIAGWEGVFCNQGCLSGTYGTGCRETCGNCRSLPCRKDTGSCNKFGCQSGFYGDTCKHECPAGKYGANCKFTCGMCGNGASCDPRNGSCPYKCDVGWIGNKCQSVCPEGMFGEACNSTCGVCKSREPCDPVTGRCKNGCAEGFHGDNCAETGGDTGDVSNAVMSTFVSAAGAIVFLFLTLLCACIVIKWRQEKNLEDYDHRVKRKLLTAANGHV